MTSSTRSQCCSAISITRRASIAPSSRPSWRATRSQPEVRWLSTWRGPPRCCADSWASSRGAGAADAPELHHEPVWPAQVEIGLVVEAGDVEPRSLNPTSEGLERDRGLKASERRAQAEVRTSGERQMADRAAPDV